MTRSILLMWAIAATLQAYGQTRSPFNGQAWGVVVDHPGMKDVRVLQDVVYFSDSKNKLRIDLYSPPALRAGEKVPAIIFLNAIGESGPALVKTWEIYRTWPMLMAAHGYVGISMETDGSRIQTCLEELFKFLAKEGANHHINAQALGVYAASANVRESVAYLMKDSAFRGIKAAVLYYGQAPTGPFRKDLPVLFVVAEGDARGSGYSNLWTEVLKNKAPWTIMMASDLPHAFDAFSDEEKSKRTVMQTISFWKNNLDPVAPSTPSKAREVLATQYWNDDQKVIRLMTDWLKENPATNDSYAFSMIGNAYFRTGDVVSAEKYYSESAAADPTRIANYMVLAAISFAQDKHKEADAYIARYEKGPNADLNWANRFLAFQLYRLKDFKDVIPYLEKAVTISSPNAADFYNLGCSYAMTGNRDKAFANLNEAVARGIRNKAGYEDDPNLAGLKDDKRWIDLMGKME